MSSATIHLVIPVLLVLATRLFPTRQVLLWAPFALLPDLDTAINLFSFHFMGETVFAHRAVFHNVFILLPTGVFAYVLWRRMRRDQSGLADASWRTRWDAFAAVKWGYGMVLATFYLFTQLFLDMFAGGITVFWPLLDVYVYPRIIVFVDLQTGAPSVAASVVTGQGAPALRRNYPWLTAEEVAIWILVALAWLAYAWYDSSRARGEEALEMEGD